MVHFSNTCYEITHAVLHGNLYAVCSCILQEDADENAGMETSDKVDPALETAVVLHEVNVIIVFLIFYYYCCYYLYIYLYF